MDDHPIKAVVDASAVLAWIFEERGANIVEKYLSVSGISAVNLGEVLYRCRDRGMSLSELEDTEADLAEYGLRWLSLTRQESHEIVTVKQAEEVAGITLSMADRCCLATALTHQVPVIASDGEWELLDLDIEVISFR